jgi:EAL and modified HD-GYP domain-containing signal transduction protein
MPPIPTASPPGASVSIARQPIFDDKRRLWGYELFGVGCDTATPSGLPAGDDVAIRVAASAQIGLQEICARGRKVLVRFDEKSLLERLPYALPPALTAVAVPEDLYGHPQVPGALEQLKADGYLIAVTGFSGRTACAPLYRLADVMGLDAGQRPADDLAGRLAAARSWKALTLARRVSDPARFDDCRAMGFSLFQGSFFKSPGSVTVRQFTSTETSRLQLLRLLEAQDPDTAQLADTIQADVALSFRLLAYLNSAAFGLTRKIGSVHQAITLLGWRNLRTWLRVVLLADMGQTREAPELVLLAAQRGKFLERIAETHDFWGFDPESLHLLGLFSLLDALLGLPMAEIVDYLPLDQNLKAALCREPGSPYTPLLRLAQCCEEARWGEAASRIRQLNMDEAAVKAAFQMAIDWAAGLSAPPESADGGAGG